MYYRFMRRFEAPGAPQPIDTIIEMMCTGMEDGTDDKYSQTNSSEKQSSRVKNVPGTRSLCTSGYIIVCS